MRLSPLLGAAVGLVGGVVYWLAVQLWPTSIAVLLAMLATYLMPPRSPVTDSVFYLLIKYSALMALSTAKPPFAAPDNVALGLIMVCGLSSSRAVEVSATANKNSGPPRAATLDVAIALLLGFAPAALLGIPGLSGLVVAIVASTGFVAIAKLRRTPTAQNSVPLMQPVAELSFYLGALATWSYV